ncbi:MAG: penicillin-binding protein 2 [Candidatus Paceibacterota bacterium]|jgi:cell division protein FtsI (penicillin-binding protein 3)/stage V sporulation protein D (sporulation-specific penicillin-binding protein)
MKYKFWTIRLFFTAFFIVLIAQIYSIQINKGDYYAQKVQAQEGINDSFKLSRGVIYFTDKNNNPTPAVLNKDYAVIYSVPKEIKDPLTTSRLLAPILELDETGIEKLLSKSNDLYELLLEKADSSQVNQIKSLNLKGIYIRNESFRYYPFGRMASHFLGFISSSQDGSLTGKYGLELQFNEKLKGTPSKNGDSLYTTIDRSIQSESEKTIAKLMEEWQADSAGIIVQDPYSGKILAMASLPDFDPNQYNLYNIKDFINPLVQLIYEPGSVFKPLTMSAGIDSGKITPQTTYTDTGFVTLNKRTIRNWDLKSYGLQTMTNVLERSLNTGSIFAERTTGHQIFYDYVKKFGLGEKTGISLPGEIKGSTKTLDGGKDINYATASFGQGISATPLQMISAFSAIANGGVLMKPLILQDEQPKAIQRVMSPETSKKVAQMMVSAVDVNILAHINQYNVAGKTGTAFIPDFNKGGYTDNVINTYIGFAPAFNPRFTILVKLENPSGAPLAGQTVVPAFKKMSEFLLNYYGIAPDRETTQ